MIRSRTGLVMGAAAFGVFGSLAVAWAAVNPLTFSATVSSGVLSIVSGKLPKNLFSTKNVLDRHKTDLKTDFVVGETSCSWSHSGSVSSTCTGNFTDVPNPYGDPIAYYWDTTVDVSGAANHWYRHHHCDGSVEIHGCAVDAPVKLTMTALDAMGKCRVYMNDAGQPTCTTMTKQTTLPAVQDADVYDECDDSCGIGACVASCEDNCVAGHNGTGVIGRARENCIRECPCNCKLQLPETCESQAACLDEE